MKKATRITAIHYHEATKHHVDRFARSSGYLDWETQPNPFRFYEGVTPLRLPLCREDPGTPYEALYERSLNQSRAFSPENLARFLELALGLSAWKSVSGAKWALRMNPSSGNLHPTESYLFLPAQLGNVTPGVYHYSPLLHALEARAYFSSELSATFQTGLPQGGFLFALTSIYWREAWKYGERAFRYCNHDIGHAIAAAGFSAALLGWKVSYLNEISDEELGRALGFPKTQWADHEKEYPEALFCVCPADANAHVSDLDPELIDKISALSFQGRPNQLSADHVDWEIISEVAETTLKPRTPPVQTHLPEHTFKYGQPSALKAAHIIRRRRSLLACDGQTHISKEVFFAMLEKTLPRAGAPPFDVCPGPAQVHLFLFVHRVQGLAPGLYMFVRSAEKFDLLKEATDPTFLWKQIEHHFPLYLLREGVFSREATSVSCQQWIAGDGAFSLGMIAGFRDAVEKAPYMYRRLFWESGMIGQVLYLEAEAYGVRGTGIGCFFDDPVHAMLGLRDNQFQSLYHFTVGGPVEDTRLQTWPPYHHLLDKESAPGQ